MHIHVVRVHVDVAETLDEQLHAFRRVVDAANQHRLVANENTALEEHAHRTLGDPRDFFGSVEVRVQHDFFAQRAAAFDD